MRTCSTEVKIPLLLGLTGLLGVMGLTGLTGLTGMTAMGLFVKVNWVVRLFTVAIGLKVPAVPSALTGKVAMPLPSVNTVSVEAEVPIALGNVKVTGVLARGAPVLLLTRTCKGLVNRVLMVVLWLDVLLMTAIVAGMLARLATLVRV